MSADVLAELFEEGRASIAFRQRPNQIPGDLRIGWRVSALVLVLDRCWGKTANMEQIHLLVWALRSKGTRDLVGRWFEGRPLPEDFVVRFDPSMTRTIALCVAGRIVKRNANYTITLAEAGEGLAEEIRNSPNVMAAEKRFLAMLPKTITQKSIRALLEWS